MAIVDGLLLEFDREMGSTRRLLERVPEGRFAWRPHPTSRSLGELAAHLAGVPAWVPTIVTQPRAERDTATAIGPPAPVSTQAILDGFDRDVRDGRAALTGRTDAELVAPWTFVLDGKDLFTLPKIGALRNLVLNHLIHHRGQLSVYLRMQEVPIPSIYGPSGDEGR